MDKIKYTLFIGLCLFGGTLAAKAENDWLKENYLQGLIDIDEDKGMYQGSGDKQMNDDDDMMMDYSGKGEYDEDGKGDMEWEQEVGSAEMEKDLTDCKRLKAQTSKMKDLPYVPKCTDDGLFERVQCNFDYEECFCVDPYGRKIIGTSKFNADTETRRTMCDDEYREIDIEGPTKGKGVKSRPGEAEEESSPVEIDETVDQEYFDQDQELKNTIDNMNGGVEVDTIEPDDDGSNNIGTMLGSKGAEYEASPVMNQPGLLAAIIGGTVVGLLCAVLLVMFIVYRMRKKDEGSYALDEPTKRSPSHHQYQRASNREFYA